jgi:hypothetical protein
MVDQHVYMSGSKPSAVATYQTPFEVCKKQHCLGVVGHIRNASSPRVSYTTRDLKSSGSVAIARVCPSKTVSPCGTPTLTTRSRPSLALWPATSWEYPTTSLTSHRISCGRIGTQMLYLSSQFARRNKLPAISGIVRAFHPHLGPGSKYLAGLWIEDIAYALSWGSNRAVQRPPFYRAPTFSWACTDGAVHYQFAPRTTVSRRFVTLEDHGLELASEDPFGCVAGG